MDSIEDLHVSQHKCKLVGTLPILRNVAPTTALVTRTSNDRRASEQVSNPSISTPVLSNSSTGADGATQPVSINVMSPVASSNACSCPPTNSHRGFDDSMDLDQPSEDASRPVSNSEPNIRFEDKRVKKGARRGPLAKRSRVKAKTVRAMGANWASDLTNSAIPVSDVKNPELAEFTRSLATLFEDFERYLFKWVEGAGSAICVAIGVLYIVFFVLEKAIRQLHFSILSEADVESVLQALFGLLSMAYRNTGILDVLQEFSGRELNPRKFDKFIRVEEIQTSMSSQHHADAGDPSSDIIEALQKLFSGPGSPCAEGAGALLENPEASNQFSPYTGPDTSSNPQGTQRLDPSKFYVLKNPHDFFKQGRVFSYLTTETLGGSKSNSYSSVPSLVSSNSWGELAYSQIQRYIVVKSRPKENHALCLAIKTYGGRGVAKKGVDAQTHTIVYTTAHPPAQLENEPRLERESIKVVASSPKDKLDPTSRVNLGKIHTVEMNMKVKDVGMVDLSSLPLLINYWKELMDL
ncbi:MAG: hypothetical protein Q9225_005119 [Loekoesia sp. 1 TL-2023]